MAAVRGFKMTNMNNTEFMCFQTEFTLHNSTYWSGGSDQYAWHSLPNSIWPPLRYLRFRDI